MACIATCTSPLSFTIGETQMLVFHLKNEAGHPYDATGCTAHFVIADYINANMAPYVSLSVEIKQDLAIVTIGSADTRSMQPSKYSYQLTLKDADGNVEVPSQGHLFLRNNHDRQFLN